MPSPLEALCYLLSADAPGPAASLTSLDVSRNPLGSRGAAALGALVLAPYGCVALQRLRAVGCAMPLHEVGVALAAHASDPADDELDFDDGRGTLARPTFAAYGAGLGGPESLLASLAQLDLSGNRLDQALAAQGLGAFAAASRALRNLTLRGVGLTAASVGARCSRRRDG